MTDSPAPATPPAASAKPGAAVNPAKAAVFIAAGIFAATPWCQPWMALALGMVLALAMLTAFDAQAKKLSRTLIQICIVLLGLRLPIDDLARAAASGIAFAAATIVGTMVLGLVAGRLLKTEREITLLISSGTAVCGGSAIAAVGASIGAASTSMAVATGAVFILNALALYAFPAIGHALELTQQQFGTWAGVAIHDMSSVVNAAKAYGAEALDTANVVKLSRVIWIAPIALFAGWLTRRAASGKPAAGAKQPIVPFFIILFIAASAARKFIPGLSTHADTIKLVAGSGFQVALFLIGAGLSRKAIASVGWRAMVLAVTLWVFISVTSLLVIRSSV